ncbi:TonB-dependent receptor [bacterium]|nr:TonB-dependent receptor [bacterium]
MRAKSICNSNGAGLLQWSIFVVVVVLFSSAVGLAEDGEQGEREADVQRRITVVGSSEVEDTIPGSIYFMEPEELQQELGGFDDIHQVLRKIPGVNIQEEDGFGLRPNIGFRGVSTERSARITLMEDGVLSAPAPYSAPSAYFFPPVGRMESLEVLKGASIIKYGPYTTGGSLNLLSTSIPNEFRAFSRFEFGQNDARKVHALIGDSFENGGVLFETYQNSNDGFKDLDTGGDTGFDIADYVAKFRVNSLPQAEFYQQLEFKMNYYDQDSDETYVGLTEGDFENTPFRRYAATQLDNIQVDRRAFTLTHYAEFNDTFDLTTVGYHNRTSRNWFKLEKAGGQSASSVLSSPDEFAEELGWIRGDTNSPVDALALRNNARDYEAYGVQSTLGADFSAGTTEHALEFSVRYHEDEEDRLQDEDLYQMTNRTLVQTTDGAVGSNANRVGSAEAWAFTLQDRVSWEDFTFTPGVRYEYIDYLREDFKTADPLRVGTDLVRTSNTVGAVIPGVGAHYQVNEEVGVFFGVHKGFSPPGPAGNSTVEEEESVNYEWGGNYNSGAFRSELVLFYNDYDNLLGADTVSSGGEGTGDLFNGGESSVFGVEASTRYDLSELIPVGSYGLPVYLTYTYTDAQFESNFDSDFFGLVQDGDAIPYIAENQLAFGVGLTHEIFAFNVDARYQDGMPTIAGQSGTMSTEDTDDFFVLDIEGRVRLSEDIHFVAALNNVLDEEYIVARRPAGARPGAPRLLFAGVEVDLG